MIYSNLQVIKDSSDHKLSYRSGSIQNFQHTLLSIHLHLLQKQKNNRKSKTNRGIISCIIKKTASNDKWACTVYERSSLPPPAELYMEHSSTADFLRSLIEMAEPFLCESLI